MTQLTLTVDPGQLDKWIEQDLRRCYVDSRTIWHNQPDNDQLCEALLIVIQHYMSHDAFEKWYETIKEL